MAKRIKGNHVLAVAMLLVGFASGLLLHDALITPAGAGGCSKQDDLLFNQEWISGDSLGATGSNNQTNCQLSREYRLLPDLKSAGWRLCGAYQTGENIGVSICREE